MSNFLPPRYRATDANGAPISGAKLYFYETGTTTPLATYSDQALTSANANPAVSDGNGYFGAIYLQEAAYRVKLTDADDVQIYSVDGVRAPYLNDSALAVRMAQVASSPLDQGAIGDGAADESAEVQAAINAASGKVDLLGKTFKCNTGITVPSGVTICNGTLNFSACTSAACISIAGTLGTNNVLTGNVAVAAVSVPVTSVAGLAAGDLLVLSDQASASTAADKMGEIIRIDSISSLNLLLGAPLGAAYTTANSAKVRKMTKVEGVVLEDLQIVGRQTGSLVGIDISAAENVTVSRCTFTTIDIGVRVANSANVSIDRLRVVGAAVDGIRTLHANYGIAIAGCDFSRCGTNGLRIGFSDGNSIGVSRGVTVSDCSIEGADVGIFVDEMSHDTEIESTDIALGAVTAGTVGVQIFGSDTAVRGCKLDKAGQYGVYWYPKALAYNSGYAGIYSVDGCRIRNSTENIRCTGTATNAAIEISDCRISGGSYGVRMAMTALLNAAILGNTIKSATTAAIDLDKNGSGTDFYTNVVVANNYAEGTSVAIQVAGTGGGTRHTRVAITGNVASSAGTGIASSWAQNTVVAGNAVYISGTGTKFGIYVVSLGAAVSGNSVTGVASAPYALAGIAVDTSALVEIAGNFVASFQYGIYGIGEISGVISGNAISAMTAGIYSILPFNEAAVVGNNIYSLGRTIDLSGADVSGSCFTGNVLTRVDDGGTNVNLAGTAGGNVNGIVLAGNRLKNGTYGIAVSNAANCYQHANIYESMATARTDGAGLTEAADYVAF